MRLEEDDKGTLWLMDEDDDQTRVRKAETFLIVVESHWLHLDYLE